MLLGDKVKIIMEELDSKAASIPGYMEKYYSKAIISALTRIDRQEVLERGMYAETEGKKY